LLFSSLRTVTGKTPAGAVEKVMEPRKILIVEDSHSTREYLTELVQILGFQAHAVMQKTDFLPDLNQHNPDLLLLGSCTNHGQIKAFTKVVELEKKCLPIIYIVDGTDELEAANVLPGDSICCLPETFNPDDLKLAIDRMIKESQDSEYKVLNETIIGESPAIKEIKKHIARLSKSDVAVLITGESGTGKDLVARAIHDFSPRSIKPFIKVNSAALPGNLVESELFGYEKGAFTGAWRSKPGKFVLAHSGTILLDEIGDIPLHLQPKLLQVLEDDELSVLGGTTNEKIDVRVLASTNSDLKRKVSEGQFRSDLYYRLNVVAIHVPPLRDRLEDIAPLCKHFLSKYADLNGNDDLRINGKTQESMYRYSWPGNVRELENTIKSIYVLGNDESFLEKLRNQHLRDHPFSSKARPQVAHVSSDHSRQSIPRPSLREVCKEAARKAETATILDVLSYTRWNRRKTAALLKISYKALLNKIKEYEIEDRYRELVRDQMSVGSGR
jgi:DNA-binding NtrC family response regulator